MSVTFKRLNSVWSRIKHTLFSAEAADIRRQRLIRDMARSPVSDIRSILKSGGKFFAAPPVALPINESITLPSWKASSIAGTELDLQSYPINHVSMLTICFSAYAESQLESFRKPFLEQYVKVGKCQIVDVRPLMSRMKWLLFSTILRSAALSAVPSSLHSSFIVTYRPMVLLDTIKVPNYLGAYVYLIDRAGRVRWQASGEATPAELEAMHLTIKQLISH